MENSFKFIDGTMKYSTITDLDVIFGELKECLKSEKIDLSMDDILRSYDVFLRIIGIGKGYNSENPDDFCEIFSICGPIKCADVASKMAEGEIDLEIYQSIFDSIDSISKDEYKFNDIECIKDNLITLFKEFTIFTNDLFGYMIEFRENNKPNIGNSVYTMHDIPTGKFVSFSIVYNTDINGVAVTVMSNVLSSVKADKVSIIVDSFEPEIRERLLEREKQDQKKGEAE